MGADAKPQAGAADGRQISFGQILLAKVKPLAALLDRDLPEIIDDQRRPMLAAEIAGGDDFGPKRRAREFLDAKLHETDAKRQQTPQPFGRIHDRVEGIGRGNRRAHSSHALPTTGVEGSAMSRISIGSAFSAMLPASTASAKARAMATGSPACATAVFSSTASMPSSMARAAWLGTPSPASITSGTSGKCARRVRSPSSLLSPRPEPIGAPQGISTSQPASSSRSATIRSSVV